MAKQNDFDLSRFDDPKGLDTFRNLVLPGLAVLETIATSIASRGTNVGTTSLKQIESLQKEKGIRDIGREKALQRALDQQFKEDQGRRADKQLGLAEKTLTFNQSQAAQKAEAEEKAAAREAARRSAIVRDAQRINLLPEEEQKAAARQLFAQVDPKGFSSKTAFPFNMDEFVAKTVAGAQISDVMAQGREKRKEDQDFEKRTRKQQKELDDALGVFEIIKETAAKVPTVKKGVGGFVTGAGRSAKGAVSENEDVKKLTVLADVLIPFVAKKISGEVGNLAAQEQIRAKSLLPNVFDTDAVRDFKLNTLEFLIRNKFTPETKHLVDEKYNQFDSLLESGTLPTNDGPGFDVEAQ